MENINESFTKYTRSNLDAMLKKDYATAVKNPEFKKLVNTFTKIFLIQPNITAPPIIHFL